jgi:hypothetical protein
MRCESHRFYAVLVAITIHGEHEQKEEGKGRH